MIKKISLDNYGKFRNERFDFGAFTMVYGPNEAGKTTLFDALFEAACAAAPKRGQVWARLASRYGEDRKARASGAVPAFGDAVEFLELFAIRAGQISVDAEKGGSWAEAAKNSLYRHGYNPAEIAGKLEKRASVSNATRHQKNLNRLNSDLAETREKAALLRSQETAIAAAKTGLAASEADIAALENKKSVLAAELAAAGGRLDDYKKIRALHQGLRDRDLVAGAIQAEKKLAEVSGCNAEALKEYDLLADKIAAAERGVAEISGTINATLDTIGKLDGEKASLLESQRVARRIADAAQRLLPELEKITRPGQAAGPEPRPPAGLRYGIWGFGAAGAALGLYMAKNGPLGYVLAAFFAAAAVALDRYLFRAADLPAGLAAGPASLAAVYDQWVNLGFARVDIERDTPAGVMEAALNLKAMARSWDIAVENNRKDGLAARAALKELNDKSITLAEDKDACAAAARKWLAGAGCPDRDGYLSRANLRQSLAGETARNSARIKELLELEKCSGPASLITLLDSRVKELEGAGVRVRPDYERDMATQENRVIALSAERAELEEELGRRKIERENLSVTFNKDLARVPETLNALCRREYDLEQEIAADALARSGAELAAGVYREIEADSSRKFEGLAREVGILLARVLPLSDLHIGSLSLESVALKDAGGAMRALDDLSSGTRDCFMLAARLTLAAAARGAEPGLMLLDDPFPALDAPRRAAALTMLRHFQRETGWQLIIFTKDKTLLAEVEGDPQVTICQLV
ncbi:MAG: hypothetical protein A2234_04855 [Elusimicrobia bacterium RIFOXYA2_FULL_58_8]|nr:MAG: hypothetical protein A2285_07345 [Elusimicrobia bacterium RIFOXYA12_FULL_57_11]OGS16561.1 MAG: hypothetical protein A2234_04855 [Elusimicrobia bacterium RIFOXYA2_FULL_58_8]